MDEPFETHRTSYRRRDSRAATRSIIPLLTTVSDPRVAAPAGPPPEEVVDRHGEVVVRVEKAGGPGHDAVPIGVRVVAECDVEPVAHRDQPRHREREEQSIRIFRPNPAA